MSKNNFSIHNYFQKGKTVVLTLKEGAPTSQVRQWSDEDVGNLLSRMVSHLPKFRQSGKRKKDVWTEISVDLCEKEGCSWSTQDCRKKWSNMIRTFRGIQESGGDKRITWPFYQGMADLFASEGAETVPEASTILQCMNKANNPSANEPVATVTHEHEQSQNPQEQEIFFMDSSADFQTEIEVSELICSTTSPNPAKIQTIETAVTVGADNSQNQKSDYVEKQPVIKNTTANKNCLKRNHSIPTKRNIKRRKEEKKSPGSNSSKVEEYLSTILSQNNRIIDILSTLAQTTRESSTENKEGIQRLCNLMDERIRNHARVTTSHNPQNATMTMDNENDQQNINMEQSGVEQSHTANNPLQDLMTQNPNGISFHLVGNNQQVSDNQIQNVQLCFEKLTEDNTASGLPIFNALSLPTTTATLEETISAITDSGSNLIKSFRKIAPRKL